MSYRLGVLPIAVLLATSAAAEVDIYGKANVSVQRTEEGSESYSELVSNASRLGFRGEEALDDALKAVYRIELEYGADDGDPGANQVFRARNTYVGIEGGFGTVLAGKMDTPLKLIQAKVDIFNDMAGDISNIITASDNRTNNTLQYITPDSLGAFSGRVGFIMSEEDGVDDGVSLAGSVDLDKLLDGAVDMLVGVAIERSVEAEDADVIRLGAQWDLGFVTLGALWEDQDPGDSGLNDANGWLVSSVFDLAEKLRLGLQYGQSDIVEEGGETYGAKLDYLLNDKAYLYTFIVEEESDLTIDNNYIGVGFELNF